MLKLPSILSLFFLIALVLKPVGSLAVVPIQEIKTNQKISRKNMEKKLGRKLKMKERISLWILKKKLQKTGGSKTYLPTLAMISSFISITPYIGILFGLLGILLGLISFFFVKKSEDKRKYKKRAWIAIILGFVITALHIGIIVLLGGSM